MPEKTKEDFFTDAEGSRWFKTGDIGRIEADGKLTIVDRRKDLIKLQLGEYISLGKVESELKTCPLVDNCCIHGDGMQNYVVALIVPVKERLEALAERLGVTGDFEELCKHKDITGAVLKELQTHGKRVGLQKFELPGDTLILYTIINRIKFNRSESNSTVHNCLSPSKFPCFRCSNSDRRPVDPRVRSGHRSI